MAQMFTCTVNEVGPVVDAAETPSPAVYLCLSDAGGSFDHTWFFAANQAKWSIR